MRTLKDLKVKIFADGADKAGMLQLNANPLIQGMTTNPSLMRKAGVTDFEAFARDILQQHHREADFVRGVFRRLSGNAAPGAENQRLGEKRLCQNPHHQHARRIVAAADSRTGERRREAQHHRDSHRGTGCRRGPGAHAQGARVRFRFCRTHRRHGRGSDAASCSNAKES